MSKIAARVALAFLAILFLAALAIFAPFVLAFIGGSIAFVIVVMTISWCLAYLIEKALE